MSNQPILDALIQSYNDELETMMNYLAASVNLEGVRAEHIKKSLEADISEEFGHAQLLAKRIHVIGGDVPGSQALSWQQSFLQPPKKSTDVLAIIKGVIEAEEQAIAGYQKIIDLCEGKDYPTQDMAIEILSDEQSHRREFVGFLKEFEDKL